MSSKITLDRLAAANPAPEHGIDIDDSKLLLAIQERSVAMSTNTERKATRGIPPLTGSGPPKRQRGWIVALAAFAVVMVVGLAALLCVSGMLFAAASVERLIGKQGLVILSKLTGLVLAALAAQIGIDELTDEHWEVIRFVRSDYAAEGESPTLRRVTTVGEIPTKSLFKLFPKKPAKKMSYIAGVPKPHGCV